MATHATPDIDLSGDAPAARLSLAEILDVPPEFLDTQDSGWVCLAELAAPAPVADRSNPRPILGKPPR